MIYCSPFEPFFSIWKIDYIHWANDEFILIFELIPYFKLP